MKRWTLKITLCLLAGAVVTWAVAWGCVLLDADLEEVGQGAALFPDGWHEGWMYNRFGATLLWVSPDLNPRPPLEGSPRFTAPGWARTSTTPSLDVRTWAFGWPERSLYGVTGFPSDPSAPAPAFVVHWVNLGTDFPTGVHFLGFALDTLLYGGVVLGVVEGVGFARRRRRIAKGCCHSCGYDRRGLVVGAVTVCPECGVKA